MLDRTSYVPLYIQVRDIIKKQISDKVYKAGDLIPSEKNLMEEFGVGRATIREAVGQLVIEGIVEKRQGVGTFVCKARKNIGFEPLISLSYLFRNSGYKLVNKVLKEELIDTTDDLRLNGFDDDKVFYIERNRYSEKKLVIVEKIYFKEVVKALGKQYDFTKSLGNFIIEELDLDISKVAQEVEMEKASPKLIKEMNLNADDNILSLKRKIFIKGENKPYQYYEMRVCPSFSNVTLENIFSK